MRLLIPILCVLAFAKANSQPTLPQDSTIVSIEKPTAISAVKSFFKHFHEQDTTALKECMLMNIQLTSMSINGGNRKLITTKATQFLKNIASIPDSIPFEERLIEIRCTGDTQIATVSTTYEFYYNNFLSHIGTNKFTLFFIDDKWVIVGIADTRIYGS
ncbi:nuclear transport factor 2 family protein [Nonlabens sp.]|uniref:nuclear transport factor 2 family protein n=1 Tax=Nonlabens sp. TaxID=1888209 RepID=UPI0025D016E1|nr:nuclear transport factor 2 family protein [Nonlabens sp.]